MQLKADEASSVRSFHAERTTELSVPLGHFALFARECVRRSGQPQVQVAKAHVYFRFSQETHMFRSQGCRKKKQARNQCACWQKTMVEKI